MNTPHTTSINKLKQIFQNCNRVTVKSTQNGKNGGTINPIKCIIKNGEDYDNVAIEQEINIDNYNIVRPDVFLTKGLFEIPTYIFEINDTHAVDEEKMIKFEKLKKINPNIRFFEIDIANNKLNNPVNQTGGNNNFTIIVNREFCESK